MRAGRAAGDGALCGHAWASVCTWVLLRACSFVCLWSLLGCRQPARLPAPLAASPAMSSDPRPRLTLSPPSSRPPRRAWPSSHGRHFCRDARGTPCDAAPRRASNSCAPCLSLSSPAGAGGPHSASISQPHSLPCDRSDSRCAGAPTMGGLTSAQVAVSAGPSGGQPPPASPLWPPPPHTLGSEHWSLKAPPAVPSLPNRRDSRLHPAQLER